MFIGFLHRVNCENFKYAGFLDQTFMSIHKEITIHDHFEIWQNNNNKNNNRKKYNKVFPRWGKTLIIGCVIFEKSIFS